MEVNKVITAGKIRLDLTSDTVTEADVLSGKTFHKADGTQAIGTAEGTGASANLLPLTVTENGTYEGVTNQMVTIPLVDNPELYIANPETAINYFPVAGFTCESKEDLKDLKLVIHGTDDNVYGDKDIWGEETENGVLYTYATSDGTYTSVVFNEETIAVVCHQDGSQEGVGLPGATLNTLYLMRDKVFIDDFTASAGLTKVEQVNVDGYSAVTVDVSEVTIQPITIIKNGVYEGTQVGTEKVEISGGSGTLTIEELANKIKSGEIVSCLVLSGILVCYTAVDIAIPDNLEELTSDQYYLTLTPSGQSALTIDFSTCSGWDYSQFGVVVPSTPSNMAEVFVLYMQMVKDKDIFLNSDIGGMFIPKETLITGLGIAAEDIPDTYGVIENNKAYILTCMMQSETNIMTVAVDAQLPSDAPPVDGYLPITVDVQPKLEDKSITANGEYSAGEGYDGLGNVNVNISLNLEDKTITTNGEYSASEGYNGINKVNVNVKPNLEKNRLVTGNYTYTANTGYDGMYSVKVNVPIGYYSDTITGVKTNPYYSMVEEGQFKNLTNLEKATLSSRVTVVKAEAFQNCTNLKEVEFPSGIKTIENNAFEGCNFSNGLTIPESITTIGDYAFNKAKNVTFPETSNLTTIGDYAFGEGTVLGGTLALPSKVTRVGAHAFGSPTSIKIPASLTWVGEQAFSNTTQYDHYGIKNYYITDLEAWCKIHFDGDINSKKKLYLNDVEVTEVVVPDTITMLEDYTFSYLSNLSSVTLPEALTSIGKHTFRGCGLITSIDVPESVTSIGEYAFSGCAITNLPTLPSGITRLENFVFGSNPIEELTLHEGITYIGDGACNKCKKVNLPSTLTYLGNTPFYGGGDNYATKIYINDLSSWLKIEHGGSNAGTPNVTGYYAVLYVNGESMGGKTIVIPADIKVIPDYCFSGISQNFNIVLHDEIERIGDYAFNGCRTGTTGTYYNGVGSGTDITFPASINYIGKNAFTCCTFNTINILSNIDIINEQCFRSTKVTSISLPNSVLVVDRYAFANSQLLTTINLPDSITSINEYAFNECAELEITSIPSNITNIGEKAFYGIKGITVEDLTLPSTLTTVGTSAFSGVKGIKKLTFNSTTLDIGVSAFYNAGIEELVFNENCNLTLAQSSFNSNTSLSSVRLPSTIEEVTGFQGCSSLTNIILPSSVKTIGQQAFYASGLTSIEIPNSVTSIGNSAFANCANLSSIILNDGITQIGDSLLFTCPNITSITIPSTVAKIGKYAFSGCGTADNKVTIFVLRNTPATVTTGLMSSVTTLNKIVVPDGTGATYKAKNVWKLYADYIIEASEYEASLTEPETPTEEGTESTEGTEGAEA